jgi:serpin B
MYVVLSEEPVDIASFIKKNEPRMTSHLIEVTLPKFTFESKFELKEPLMAMGIRKAFTDEAEFNAMSDLEQKISNVIQNTYIAVDEEGTEAAAATVLMMEATSAMPEEPFAAFTADRPFQFAIRDNKSGEILFAGAYNKVE